MRMSWISSRRLAVAGVSAALALAPGLASAREGHGRPHTLVVSARRGADANDCSVSAPCATIGHAVSIAKAGERIVVEHGVYAEDVHLPTRLSLVGEGFPVIDATGLDNGFVAEGPAVAGSLVSGFTVKGATFEGILLRATSDVTIEDDVVRGNDQGVFLPPGQQSGECLAVGVIPGDCGEGIHLWSVTGARVLRNWVEDNAGGILLTDESGPTSDNVILGNVVVDNPYDCGITLASHNPAAAPGGVPAPAAGGIFDNLIRRNRVDRNGLKGEGAGILLAGGPPGIAVYDNQIIGNEASGNGLSGLTLHSHAPGQDFKGNVIRDNRFSHDNLSGDGDFTPYVDTQTTGVLIASAAPLTDVTVEDNEIADCYYGIWTLNAPVIPEDANEFVNVTVPLMQQ